MPRDSNGIMTLPASTWVQTGDTVLPVQHNPPFRDIENALTNSIDRDGRTVMTGNLQMGGNRVTGLGDPSLPGDAMTRRVSGIEFETRALAEAWPGVDTMPETISLRGYNSENDGRGGVFARGVQNDNSFYVNGVLYGRVSGSDGWGELAPRGYTDHNLIERASLYRAVGGAVNGPPQAGTASLVGLHMPYDQDNTQFRQLAMRHSNNRMWTRYSLNTGEASPWIELPLGIGIITLDEYTPAKDGATDDGPVFNQALNGGNKTLFVPPGDYMIRTPIRLFANTHIILSPNAHMILDETSMFLNGVRGDDNFSTGYDGPGNIHIEGGRFSTVRTSGAQTAFIQIAHAENVLVENCVFESLWRGHYIEYNAVRNGTVRNCVFKGQQILPTDSGRDAINIDFSYQTGFPTFGAWDGTVCDGIFIHNNSFFWCQTSASSHGATQPPGGFQQNIFILNNYIMASGQYAIWGRYWRNFIIEGNRIHNTGSIAIYINTCDDGIIDRNIISGVGTESASHAIQVQNSEDIMVLFNRIRPSDGMAYAIRGFGGTRNTYYTDGASAGSSGVASVTDTSSRVGRPTLS